MLYAKPLRVESPAVPVAAGRGAGRPRLLSEPLCICASTYPCAISADPLRLATDQGAYSTFCYRTTEDEGRSGWGSLPDSGNRLTLDGSGGAGSGPARESGREPEPQRPRRPVHIPQPRKPRPPPPARPAIRGLEDPSLQTEAPEEAHAWTQFRVSSLVQAEGGWGLMLGDPEDQDRFQHLQFPPQGAEIQPNSQRPGRGSLE